MIRIRVTIIIITIIIIRRIVIIIIITITTISADPAVGVSEIPKGLPSPPTNSYSR